MATLNLEELRSGLISKIMPGVQDQVKKTSYLFKRLYDGIGEDARGAERYRAGSELSKMLSYKEKASTLTNGRTTVVTATFFEAEKMMTDTFSWRVADVLLYDDDISSNNTGEKIFNLMTQRIQNATDGLKKDIANDLILGNKVANPLQINGIQKIVEDDNVYAGINRALAENDFFRAKVTNHSLTPTFSLSKIDTMHDILKSGLEDRPTIQVTTKELWREMANQVASKLHIIEKDPRLLKFGIEHIVYNGSPVIDDIYIPAGEYYHLNEEKLRLYIDPAYDIILSDWEMNYGGQPNARALFIKIAYVLWCEKPSLCGKHEALAIS